MKKKFFNDLKKVFYIVKKHDIQISLDILLFTSKFFYMFNFS